MRGRRCAHNSAALGIGAEGVRVCGGVEQMKCSGMRNFAADLWSPPPSPLSDAIRAIPKRESSLGSDVTRGMVSGPHPMQAVSAPLHCLACRLASRSPRRRKLPFNSKR